MNNLNKYLKRWKKLTEKQKIMFFEGYVNYEDMCSRCIRSDGYSGVIPAIFHKQCRIMFPTNERYRFCPCWQEADGNLDVHPPTVIEYCLLADGWIEKD